MLNIYSGGESCVLLSLCVRDATTPHVDWMDHRACLLFINLIEQITKKNCTFHHGYRRVARPRAAHICCYIPLAFNHLDHQGLH